MERLLVNKNDFNLSDMNLSVIQGDCFVLPAHSIQVAASC